MDIIGQYRIPAPRERVWQALNDVEVLRASLPGCEELVRVGEREFTARIRASVATIEATFNGRVMLSDVDPPRAYTLSGRGQGGPAGFVGGQARVTLEPEGVDTVLSYSAKADVGGKLASLGNSILQGVAHRTADEFFGRFAAIVSGQPGKPPEKREPKAPEAEAVAVTGPAPHRDAASLPPQEPLPVEPIAPRGRDEPVTRLRPVPANPSRRPKGEDIVLAVGIVLFLGIVLLLWVPIF